MAVSAVYSSPITVNGYSCRSCADVTDAKKNIDPAHPRSGPNNVNAADDPSQSPATRRKLLDAKDAAAGIKAGSHHARYSAMGAPAGAVETGLAVDRTA